MASSCDGNRRFDTVAALCGVAVGASTYWLCLKFRMNKIPFAEERIGAIPPRMQNGIAAWILGSRGDEAYIPEGKNCGYVYPLWFPDPMKKPARVRLIRSQDIIIANPEDADYVLVSEPDKFPKDVNYPIMLGPLLGRGLITETDVKRHKSHRRELNPAFSPAALKDIAQSCFPSHAQDMLGKLKSRSASSAPMDVNELLADTTMCIMAQAVFKVEKEEIAEVSQAFKLGVQGCWNLLRLVPVVGSCLWESDRMVAKSKNILGRIIKVSTEAARQQAEGNVSGSGDSNRNRKMALIDYMIKSDKLTPSDFDDHCFSFMFAGFDTISHTLNNLTYLLARNPQIQEKVFEELSSLLAPNTAATLEDAKACRYLQCCIKETQRVFPTVLAVSREPAEDVVLPGTGTFIPKGTHIDVSIWQLHHLKEVWGQDVNEFRPERWEEEPELEERVGCAFVPFAAGRRNCIGKDFAMHEMLVLAATLLRNYRLLWPEGAPDVDFVAEPLWEPRKQFLLRVIPRPS